MCTEKVKAMHDSKDVVISSKNTHRKHLQKMALYEIKCGIKIKNLCQCCLLGIQPENTHQTF